MAADLSPDPPSPSAGDHRLALRCLWPGFAGDALPAWVARALDDGLAGVTLYGDNATSPTSTADLARQITRGWPGALVAVDEEGGDVTRLEYLTGSSYPGNLALGHLDDEATTEAVAADLAGLLLAAGVSVDLAPSVDVNSDPRNPVIGTRSFGAEPALVARHGAAMVRGLHAGGVVAVPKHFPGHGGTTADSHLGPALLDVDVETLRGRDLPPFAAAVAAGALAVMTSHVLVPAVDDVPATLSAAHLAGLLRGDLGFTGVIVTDALDMAAVERPDGIGAAAVRALAAGADLLLTGPGMGDDRGRERLETTVAAIVAAVADGSLERSRLADAATRVDALVEAAAALRDAAGAAAAVGDAAAGGVGLRAARAATLARGDLPLRGERRERGLTVVEVRGVTNLAVGQAAWSLARPLEVLGADVDVVTVTEAHLPAPGPVAAAGLRRTLVLAVRDVRLVAETALWVRAVLAASPDAVLVCLGMPQDADLAPEGARVVVARSASAVSTRAAAEALWGARAG